MALPSQSGRPTSRKSYMYRRRRRKRPAGLLMTIMVLVGIAIAVWQFWPESAAAGTASNDADLNAGQSEGAASGGEATTPPRHERLTTPTFLDSADDQASANREPASGPAPPPSTDLTMGSPVPGELDRAAGDPGERNTPVVATTEQSLPEGRASERLKAALDLVAMNRPVEARRRLSALLEGPGIDPAVIDRARHEISRLNELLVFSPQAVPDDPFVFEYSIQGGDVLSKVKSRLSLQVEWPFIQRINRISDPRKIREGDRLKIVTGPFHAVISKTDFRMDLYLGDGYDRVFVTSLPVGLGEYDSTPVGLFRVGVKDANPSWRNPRTGEFFGREDPDNPIGEFWLALEGVEAHNKDLSGYGIHGTIEPGSIGQQRSMGCIRMLPDDVALVYEVLVTGSSTVEIVP